MRSSFTEWQVLWTPMTIDTSRPWRSSHKEAFVAFKLNLFLVRNLSDVRSIVIHSHVTDQENSSMLEDSRKRAVDCKKGMSSQVSHPSFQDECVYHPGNHRCPV